jgi:trans-aconitate methyltransferase
MHRVLEPELMEEQEQVKAYAEADFSEPHCRFVELISGSISPDFSGRALDLGCGPGDISCRFAEQFPDCMIDAVDGSKPMLEYAAKRLTPALSRQINFIRARIPFETELTVNYDVIFSNSLLHHLSDPQVLWQTVKTCADTQTSIVIMDLLRPESESAANQLVDEYAANEPDILKHDFYHSLLAAFTLNEIRLQLSYAQINLAVEQVSNRHVLITGKLNNKTPHE